MTTPITNTPVKTNAYVQVEGGVNNYTNTKQANLGAALGGEISKGGTFAKAEVGCGTAFKAKAEVGHEFNIGKNMGLELSANAQYTQSNKHSTADFKTTYTNSYESKEFSTTTSWKDGLRKAGGALALNFKGKKGNIKAGVEVGAYKNNAPDVHQNFNSQTIVDIKNNETQETHKEIYNYNMDYDLKQRNSGMYVTPKVSAELNLGKTNNWSLVANADRFGGNAGVRFKF